uniref:UPF0235 protein n=1 Tax=uncultured marine group II/III euryarchaeote KM3_178_D06 TaxID=1457940 RepID=A0A075GPL3_9EURY|nr:hypothetical protein [uncultured marine group II/III euryarchaeote KM3_178_D06]
MRDRGTFSRPPHRTIVDRELDRWAEVVSDVTDGAIGLNIELQPNASSAEVIGINEWRKRLQVRVTSPAQKGAANEELFALMAGVFDVEKSRISIDSGLRDRRKRIIVRGIDRKSVIQILESVMEG